MTDAVGFRQEISQFWCIADESFGLQRSCHTLLPWTVATNPTLSAAV
jgi:hypothetical protein